MTERQIALLKDFYFVDILDRYADLNMRIEACHDAVIKMNGDAVVVDLIEILLQHQTELTKLKLKLEEYGTTNDELPFLIVHKEDYI